MSLSYHYMQLPREVIVGKGTLNRVPEVVKRLSLKGQALVISDEQCFELAGKTVGDLLAECGSGCVIWVASTQTTLVAGVPPMVTPNEPPVTKFVPVIVQEFHRLSGRKLGVCW